MSSMSKRLKKAKPKGALSDPDGSFSPEEAERRFQAALRSGLNTPPTRLKSPSDPNRAKRRQGASGEASSTAKTDVR